MVKQRTTEEIQENRKQIAEEWKEIKELADLLVKKANEKKKKKQ